MTEETAAGGGIPVLRYASFETDLGTFLVVRSDRGLRHVRFSRRLSVASALTEAVGETRRLAVEDRIGLRFVADAIRRYLAGDPTRFDLPLDLSDLSPFARDVLDATRSIPYGTLRTYKWVAEAIGSPLASQAVGQALARNPLPVVIPCHRVVQSDGELGGYSGGGPDMKRRLIAIETGQFDLGLERDRSETRRRVRFMLDESGEGGGEA